MIHKVRSGGSEFLAYTINISGQATVNYAGASAGTRDRDIQNLLPRSNENMVAGEDSDTVTFSISANFNKINTLLILKKNFPFNLMIL